MTKDAQDLTRQAVDALNLENFDKAKRLFRLIVEMPHTDREAFIDLTRAERWEILAHRRELAQKHPNSFWHVLAMAQTMSSLSMSGAVHECTTAMNLATGSEVLSGALVRIRAAIRTRDYQYLHQDLDTVWAVARDSDVPSLRLGALKELSSSSDPELARVLDQVVELPFLEPEEKEVILAKRYQLEALAQIGA